MSKTWVAMIWTGFGGLFLTVIKFVVLVIAARFVTPEEFGIVSIALLLNALYTVTIKNSVMTAIVREESLTQIETQNINTLCLITGILFTSIVYFCSDFLSAAFSEKDISNNIKLMSFMFIVISFSAIPHSILLKRHEFELLSKISVTSCFLGYALIGVILAIMGYQAFSMIIGILAHELISALLMGSSVKIKLSKHLSLLKLRNILKLSWANFLANSLNFIATQSDKIIVGSFLGLVSLGFYGRSYQIMSLPSTYLGKVIDTVFFPIMSSYSSDDGRISSLYLKTYYLMFVLFAPVSALVMHYSETLVAIILGKEWLEVAAILKILAIGMVFKTLHKLNSSVIKAKGARYDRTKIQFLYALLTILGCSFAVMCDFGIQGVTLAIVMALLVVFFVMTKLSLSIISYPSSNKFWFYSFGIFFHLLDWIIIKLVNIFFTSDMESDLVALIVFITSFSMVYLMNLTIYKYFYPEDYTYFKNNLSERFRRVFA